MLKAWGYEGTVGSRSLGRMPGDTWARQKFAEEEAFGVMGETDLRAQEPPFFRPPRPVEPAWFRTLSQPVGSQDVDLCPLDMDCLSCDSQPNI